MDRYNREYQVGKTTFYLEPCLPTEDQCRHLMLKMLEHTVNEYLVLADAVLEKDITAWKTARDFLFDDHYRIWWGDWELSFKDYLDILNIDIEYARKKIKKRFEEKHNG